ncbi:hypothetical protein RHGRI_009627 [Rhododendron griersonianum]|uniref:Essential protein Yae1 N-terminal domain-containing protein n=1 Tax=Rhododendron griersonianum TaxID=479676 RepID=A0AAV6KG49_9ERIC|nr:hypothetical protein RHGRI_009627 [Rhododendron griersonianum]
MEDIFDSSLNLEETHFNEGFDEGYADGLSSGKDEGRQVGLKHGFEVGEELGFYRGCIDVWNSAIRVEPTCFSSRIQKTIKTVDNLVTKYPTWDPENESVDEVMDSLRLKFRIGSPRSRLGQAVELATSIPWKDYISRPSHLPLLHRLSV